MKIRNLCFIALVAMAFISCSEKKQSNVIIAPKPVPQAPKAPAKMQEINQDMNVAWLGKNYRVVISRKADETKAMTKDESGSKYYDNIINLKVLREDGSVFFDRTFTKADFTQYLDDNTNENGALLGIVLNEPKGDDLVFAASVGSPDPLSDAYIPLVLTLSRMGAVTITKDTQMDTNGEQGTVEEDDGV